uniref:DmX-like protein 1 n=1 Tax=Cacopsylla melanoneura TaxID=428564 RepID=A0A8D8YBH7_9HEMI
MHFTLQAESILHELTRKVVEKEELLGSGGGTGGDGGSGKDSGAQDGDSTDHHTIHHPHEERPSLVITGQAPPPAALKKSKTGVSRVGKSMSQDESQDQDHHEHSFPSSSHQTLSNTTSINSLATDAMGPSGHVTDSLDAKIECLLRDWHHSPDLLFAIHPVDGSFLIWLVEWLDEYHPGSFRQAQVSFSTRIPSAFPLGDATTMSTNVSLYHTSASHLQLVFRDVVKTAAAATANKSPPTDPSGPGSDAGIGGELTTPLPVLEEEESNPEHNSSSRNEDGGADSVASGGGKGSTTGTGWEAADLLKEFLASPPAPSLSLVTKHSNGTLNLWQLTFADKTKFSQVLSIGHASRASGHRFRVNDITCHPVLPLLLTTSHHNLPESTTPLVPSQSIIPITPTGFCSELILWRVDAVGPLSKSGGVSELARINSPHISAFSNVAWIPTLLPSTTLGSLSNSPSACFVASDGQGLRVYQAVIDARTLLAEISSSERRSRIKGSMVSLSTDISSDDGAKHPSLHDKIKIVSQQSTARPGCVIQLEAIEDATHDWQNTQFLHVFQEQLITGERVRDHTSKPASSGGTGGHHIGLTESHRGPMVDLQTSAEFEEPFYLVVLERTNQGTTVHMWRLLIASQPDLTELSESMLYMADSQLVQDEDDMEGSSSRQGGAGGVGDEMPSHGHHGGPAPPPHVQISTVKVCTQELPLPDGVDVVHAAPAAGHLSSASIYPACFAPYIFVTACSDSNIRFWKCKVSKNSNSSGYSYEWAEWEMLRKDKDSAIEIAGQPMNISAAYSGRIAVAYKYGKSFTRPSKKDPDLRYINLCVAIYECESTGGSEWVLEDTLHLKNIHLPRVQLDQNLDLSFMQDPTFLSKKQRLQTSFMKAISSEDIGGNG